MRTTTWIWTALLVLLVPAALDAQPLDIIWVTNSASNSVSQIQRSSQTVVTTVRLPAGRPVGVAVAANGDAWVANQNAAAIHHVSVGGKVVGTYPASGRPTNMGIDLKGNIWCSPLSGSVHKYSPSGTPLGTFSTGGSASQGISVDSAGDVWIGDGTAGKFFKMTDTGKPLKTLSYTRHRMGAIDHQDNLFTTGFLAGDLRKYATDGTVLGTFPTPGFTSHQGLAVDRENNVWMTAQTGLVLKMSNAGKSLGSFSTGGSMAVAVAVDGIGDIWVSNFSSTSVGHLKPDGTLVKTVTVGGSPIPVGDGSGFQRAVFTDPFGDADADGHLNNAEAVAGSNVFDPRGAPCSLVLGGDQKVGGKATLDYADLTPKAAGKAYVMACSLSNQYAIPIGKKRRIDLVPDGLLFLSLQVPAIFQNFIGNLDTSGRATGTILIPVAPALASVAIHCAAITWDLTAPEGVRCIAPTNTFKIKP